MGLLLALGLLTAGQDLNRAIERLDADDPVVREAAAAELLRLGVAARAALRERRDSPEPDRAWTARRLLGRIEWEPYLPLSARPTQESGWAALGSGKPDDVLGALGSKYSYRSWLGLERKFHDLEDGELKQVLLGCAWRAPIDDALLKRWAAELPDDAFRIRYGERVSDLLAKLSGGKREVDVAFWTGLLRSPVRPRRYLAAAVLAAAGRADGLDGLLEFVGDSRSDFGERAIMVLRNSKHPPAKKAFLAELRKAGASLNVLYGMSEFGWGEDLDVLRELAGENRYHQVDDVHRTLLAAGDRSFLPLLLRELRREGEQLVFDQGFASAALLYDTDEAVDAVIERFDRVRIWGAHGVDYSFRFGPSGTRRLWERFEKECRDGVEKSNLELYLGNFVELESIMGRVREALAGDPPRRMRAFCLGALWRWSLEGDLTEVDLALLRRFASERGLEYALLRRQDPDYYRTLRAKLENAPDAATLQALRSYERPELEAVFLQHARAGPTDRRAVAVGGLARFPGPETAAVVIDAVSSEFPELRDAGFQALAGMPSALLAPHADALADAYRRSAGSYYRSVVFGKLPPRRAAALARESLPAFVFGKDFAETAFAAMRAAPEPGDVELARPFAGDWAKGIPSALEILARVDPAAAEPLLRNGLGPQDAAGYARNCAALGRVGGPEALRLLIHAALTESDAVGEPAIKALARIGGPEVDAFVRSCAAGSDAGRPVPTAWPLAAGPEHLASIARLLERSSDDVALIPMDRLLHRADHEAARELRFEGPAPKTFEEACRAVASAAGLEVEVSPALIAEVARYHAETREIRVRFSAELPASGRLPVFLSEWRPVMHVSLRRPSRYSWGSTREIAWASVLSGKRLSFLTPEEARIRLLEEWRSRPR